jgi:hypothetical protein
MERRKKLKVRIEFVCFQDTVNCKDVSDTLMKNAISTGRGIS